MLWCWRVIARKFDAVTNICDENNDCYNQRNTESNENIIFLPSLEHGIRFVCSTYTGIHFFRNISTFHKAICGAECEKNMNRFCIAVNVNQFCAIFQFH